MANTNLEQRYTEIESIGEGGMGLILKAKDVNLGREVAIKRPLPQKPQDHQQFLLEARATGQLEHPNIPAIYETGQDESGAPYFTLKLVKGKSLSAVIEELNQGVQDQHDKYRFPHRLAVFQKVCEAVAYAHRKGILHRDIKPDNIMLGDYGEVFLLDWGLSKPVDTVAANADSGFSGTPTYAAPELVQGQSASPRSDVYSLGATLYEWLSLQAPHQGESLSRILTSVVTQQPPDPARLKHSRQDKVPQEMGRVILKAMAKDPSQRYASVGEMLTAIRDILDGEILPICACSTVKYGFHEIARIIDNYPILAAFVLLWLAFPLLFAIFGVWFWFSGG